MTHARINAIWLFLAAATAVTWQAGDSGRSGPLLVAFVFALAALKGGSVILDFMELRHAPVLWRAIALGWLLVVTVFIFAAYLIGQP